MCQWLQSRAQSRRPNLNPGDPTFGEPPQPPIGGVSGSEYFTLTQALGPNNRSPPPGAPPQPPDGGVSGSEYVVREPAR